MGRTLAGCVLAAGLLGTAAGPATAGNPPSNYEWVQAAAIEACAKLTPAIRNQVPEGVVALRAAGTSPGNFLVENAFQRALTDAGMQVRTRPDSTGAIVEFEVVNLAVAYIGQHRSHWFGARSVDRESRARLFARVLDPAGAKVLWAEQTEARKVDRVPVADLVRLEEEKPAAYDKPLRPSGRWNKIAEPVVVTGILAGLIVLFFSNQNTN